MTPNWFLRIFIFQLSWTVAKFQNLTNVHYDVSQNMDFEVCELGKSDRDDSVIRFNLDEMVMEKSSLYEDHHVTKRKSNRDDNYLTFKLDKKVFVKSSYEDQHVTNLWTDHCEIRVSNECNYSDNPLNQCGEKIDEVQITSSNITGFSNDFFCYFANLRYLNLTNNNLEDFTQLGLNVSHDCLNHNGCHHRLDGLYLSGNPLKVIKNNSFCQLKRLKNLFLDNCMLTSIESGAFDPLVQLDLIRLDGNQLTAIPHFPPLKLRRGLDFSRNQLTSLTRSDFMDIVSIFTFKLSHNYITSIAEDAFKTFKHIMTLDLSYNRLNEVNMSLLMAPIRTLLLNNNYLTEFNVDPILFEGKGFGLPQNIADEYNNINLISIDVSYNNIGRLDKLRLPTSVYIFNAKNNHIDHLSFHSRYSSTLLEVFDLQNNNFSFLPTINELHIYHRANTRFPLYNFNGNPLKCSCENTWFVEAAEAHRFVSLLFETPCTPVTEFKTNLLMPKLNSTPLLSTDQLCESNYNDSNRCLDDRYRVEIKCEFVCPRPCHCYTTRMFSIVHLYCSNMQLQSVPMTFNRTNIFQQPKIILWLDGNNFTSLNSNHFINHTDLTELYLNDSNIYHIDRLTFHDITLLEVLELCDNHLQVIESGLFDNLKHLRELHLNNNNIIDLPDNTFAHLESLQTLYLHENDLLNYKVWSIMNMSSLQMLTLHGNRWSCDCNFILEFRVYLKLNSLVVYNASNLICTDDDESKVIIELDDSFCETLYEVIVSASVVSVSVVLILSVSLLFYYRREMQVLIYSRLKVRLFNRSSVNDTEGKLYDAFIAYSGDDIDFVVEKLLPGLEEIDRPYRACIHERDFLAGGVITENIMAAVGHSSRTLVVLTENFVRSGWCRFEFKTAHMQMLQDRCPRVLLIVVGDIPDDVDPEMKLYLKTYTYLKWGEKLFWQKLYYAMSDWRVAETHNHPLPDFVTTL